MFVVHIDRFGMHDFDISHNFVQWKPLARRSYVHCIGSQIWSEGEVIQNVMSEFSEEEKVGESQGAECITSLPQECRNKKCLKVSKRALES